MRLGYADIKVCFNEGNVEGFAVVGYEKPIVLNIVWEFVQVIAIHIMFDGNTIVEGDGGDVAPEETGSFDVEEGCDLLKIVVQAPKFLAG